MVIIQLKRGDTWVQTFSWKQGNETGIPVDLSGCTARLHIRDKQRRLLIDASPFLTIQGTEGVVTVEVPASLTRALPIGPCFFDIEITFADGTVRSTETMSLSVAEDITLYE